MDSVQCVIVAVILLPYPRDLYDENIVIINNNNNAHKTVVIII